MNYGMIKYTLGWLLIFEAGFFVVPAICAVIYVEIPSLLSLLASMAICGILGALGVFWKKPASKKLYARDGLVIVALSWIFLSLFGALPFVFSGAIPNYIDAFFEAASGFTTTGSSIVPAVEELPKAMLLWRSFTHWVGGMGVLVFIMAFLPLGGAQNLHIMRAESPGPTVSKLVPKMKTTALILYLIYFVLTAIMFIILLFGEMNVFDAINTAFSTAGTGGFGFKNDSFASFSSFSQIVVTVFMLIFSINFSSYYLICKGKLKDAFNLEVRTFLFIVIVAITAIAINIYYGEISDSVYNVGATEYSEGGYTWAEAFKHSAFSVASIISTTGFGTENFVAWPMFSQLILLLIMFIGACAGSTGGGIKVSRILILIKGVFRELRMAIHPRKVEKITIDKRPVENEVVRSVYAYIVCYMVVFFASLFLISFDNFDFTTNFTAVTATINNIGPGLGDYIGPTGSFAAFSGFSKIILSFTMLAGRLELLPMLLLFAPATWKKQ